MPSDRKRRFSLTGRYSYSVSPDDPTPDEPQPSTDKTYTKATSIQAGKAYVIVSNNVALRNNNGTAAAYSVSGKISGNTLTIPAADVSSVEWTTAAAGSSYSTYGDYSFANGGRYISRPGSNGSGFDTFYEDRYLTIQDHKKIFLKSAKRPS